MITQLVHYYNLKCQINDNIAVFTISKETKIKGLNTKQDKGVVLLNIFVSFIILTESFVI